MQLPIAVIAIAALVIPRGASAQRHVAKFGIKYFQVAIVSKTRARAEELKRDLHGSMSAAQQRAYHFIPLEELTLEALLAGVEKPST